MDHPLKRERKNVLFFAIGGGSDLSTADVLLRSMKITGQSALCVALGPRDKNGKFDVETTQAYYASHYAGNFSPVFDHECAHVVDALKCQRTPKKLEGDALNKAVEDIARLRILTSGQQEQFRAVEGSQYLMQGSDATYFGLIVGDDEAMVHGARSALEGFLSVKYGDVNQWEVVCVDTGGDVLAPTSEVTAPHDLVMAEDGGMRPRTDADVGVDSLVTAGMLYVPDGAGFGDRSYHQFGPSTSKRDESSLRIARSLPFSPQSLWVVGLGSDGETSERGLQAGCKRYAQAYEGSMTDFSAAMDFVQDYKEPQVNKTPWLIREALRGVTHISFTRGSKELRRRGECGQGFSSTVPAAYVMKYLVFDSLDVK